MRLQQRWAQYQTELKNIHNNKTRRNYTAWLTAKCVWVLHEETCITGRNKAIALLVTVTVQPQKFHFPASCSHCSVSWLTGLLFLWQIGIWGSFFSQNYAQYLGQKYKHTLDSEYMHDNVRINNLIRAVKTFCSITQSFVKHMNKSSTVCLILWALFRRLHVHGVTLVSTELL